jgi:hypothetical protein
VTGTDRDARISAPSFTWAVTDTVFGVASLVRNTEASPLASVPIAAVDESVPPLVVNDTVTPRFESVVIFAVIRAVENPLAGIAVGVAVNRRMSSGATVASGS